MHDFFFRNLLRLAGLSKEHPTEYHEPAARVIPLAEVFLGPVKATLSVLSTGVLALLLVACGTVANLLLLRANERTREIAVRSALGVSPGRMARQLITESLLLALAGGVAGLAPALAAVRLLAVAGPDQLPRLHQIALDERAVALAFALMLMSGVVFGLAPMRQLLRRDLAKDIQGGSRTTSGSWRLRSSLVAVNVAMAAVLLVGVGSAGPKPARPSRREPGFRSLTFPDAPGVGRGAGVSSGRR